MFVLGTIAREITGLHRNLPGRPDSKWRQPKQSYPRAEVSRGGSVSTIEWLSSVDDR